MLKYSVPPGYQRDRPPSRPKLDPYKGVIDQILEEDQGVPKKQRHTAKRIYERLRDEHGFPGKYTIVKDYVRERRRRTREMFVPLSHSPGHAQCDFGEAWVVIGGAEQKAHYLAMDLPHSDGCYVKAYPAETTEAFCDGHVSAFAFLGGVPQSIVYDNTTLAVARILGDGRRRRTRVFTELQSHYLFEDRFGRPGKGNDKGKVEGLVGYVRRNFLVPIPSFESFDALNAHLEQHCVRRFDDRLCGHNETIGERLERDLEALRPLPAVPYDASDKHATRVSSLSLVRYRTNDYSVPVAYGHRDVLVRGYVHEVVISCGSEVIARHRRSYDRDDFVFDPLHYLEADHRRHAEIENAIRDLKYGVGLNHLPSGRFAANGAWLAVQTMAHNLAHWTARIGLGQQIVTTKTLRRRFFSLAGRLTRSARRLTLHLPDRWPWAEKFSRALARLRAIPLPA